MMSFDLLWKCLEKMRKHIPRIQVYGMVIYYGRKFSNKTFPNDNRFADFSDFSTLTLRGAQSLDIQTHGEDGYEWTPTHLLRRVFTGTFSHLLTWYLGYFGCLGSILEHLQVPQKQKQNPLFAGDEDPYKIHPTIRKSMGPTHPTPKMEESSPI